MRYYNYTLLFNRYTLLVLVTGIAAGVVSAFLPIMFFVGVLSFAVCFWYFMIFLHNRFELIDVPFIALLVGTFAIGRAFSVLGLRIGSMPVFITEIVLLCTFGLIFFYGKIDDFRLRLPTHLGLIFIIYLLLGVIYLLFGIPKNGMLAFRDAVFCYYSIFLFMTLMVFKTNERIMLIFRILLPSTIIALIVGVLMVFKIVPKDSMPGRVIENIRGTNLNLYYGLIAIYCLSLFPYFKKHRYIVCLLIALTIILNILLKHTTAWIASFTAFVFMGFMYASSAIVVIKRHWKSIMIFIFAAIIMLSFFSPKMMKNITDEWYGLWHWDRTTEAGVNILWRFNIWKQALNKIFERLYFGWGFGAQINYISLHGNPYRAISGFGPKSGIIPTHNHILAITFKMGLVGLSLFLLINFRIFIYGLRYIKQSKKEFNRRFLIATLAGIIYWHTMAAFFDIMESPPTSVFLWVLLGLVLSVIHVDKESESELQN